ncbi:MAG: Fe-S cluster assembly ATPase SufC [Bifidobacteriaceae bacterium]|jgi:Fe-S cluster assembly ATP-binding protein|nr:Fe-S cluster assembly ATPase SufC [Bifidobacteriaceae bacterium]
MSLNIKGLKAKVLINSDKSKEVLQGVDLEIQRGEIHAIMGPNGSGKSTLAYTLAGHPSYEITGGSALLDNVNITGLTPDKIAKEGLFLGFQHPAEIDGVGVSNFLRVAYGSISGKTPNVREWVKKFSNAQKSLKISNEFAARSLNVGFSGGEKKKNEILQLKMLKPKYAILDEIDSGLDVDALRLVATEIDKIQKENNIGIILITHYARILEYIKPDFVHVFANGKIMKSGDSAFAKELEKVGYDKYL